LFTSAAFWVVLFLIFLLNLPFGFWRADVRRYSPPWFVAVHAPVPLVIGFRLILRVGWRVGKSQGLEGNFDSNHATVQRSVTTGYVC